jgi:hypothetical protein
MMRTFFSSRLTLTAALALAAAGLAGCAAFEVKQEVRIDAIASTKTVARGPSYILNVRNPALVKEGQTYNRALAAVSAALESKGQFLALPRTDPEYVVEIDFGVGNAIQQVNSGPIQEKFLTLSARDYVRGGRGEELWNIRVSVTEAGSSLDHALPLLAVVALENAGLDTRGETVIEIPIKSPTVARVRSLTESALIEAAAEAH